MPPLILNHFRNEMHPHKTQKLAQLPRPCHNRDKTRQLSLYVSKPSRTASAFRFSSMSAERFIWSFINEYSLNTLASPCRSSWVTHSSATPPGGFLRERLRLAYPYRADLSSCLQ
jgi:hypothetical protein